MDERVSALKRNGADMQEIIGRHGQEIKDYNLTFFYLNNSKYVILDRHSEIRRDDLIKGLDRKTGSEIENFVFKFDEYDKPKLVEDMNEAMKILSIKLARERISITESFLP